MNSKKFMAANYHNYYKKISTFLRSHYESFPGDPERLANNADQNSNQFRGGTNVS